MIEEKRENRGGEKEEVKPSLRGVLICCLNLLIRIAQSKSSARTEKLKFETSHIVQNIHFEQLEFLTEDPSWMTSDSGPILVVLSISP